MTYWTTKMLENVCLDLGFLDSLADGGDPLFRLFSVGDGGLRVRRNLVTLSLASRPASNIAGDKNGFTLSAKSEETYLRSPVDIEEPGPNRARVIWAVPYIFVIAITWSPRSQAEVEKAILHLHHMNTAAVSLRSIRVYHNQVSSNFNISVQHGDHTEKDDAAEFHGHLLHNRSPRTGAMEVRNCVIKQNFPAI